MQDTDTVAEILTFRNESKKNVWEKPELSIFYVQLRGNQKDFNFQLHHRLSKFEVPVVVNLKHIFELFGL